MVVEMVEPQEEMDLADPEVDFILGNTGYTGVFFILDFEPKLLGTRTLLWQSRFLSLFLNLFSGNYDQVESKWDSKIKITNGDGNS